ncbi:putative alpha/beta hydrolase, partial [Mycobacterium avium]
MQLRHLSIPFLVAEAGGDPWSIDSGLQAGRPAQIASLARAFHDAGTSTAEADVAFAAARGRFEASWNHRNGTLPINDSAEVQRVTRALAVEGRQLPRIATDLETIAAVLAESQRTSTWYIEALEYDLAAIDDEIGQALEEADHCAAEELRYSAVTETKAITLVLKQVRESYSRLLHSALARLQADGVDPADVRGV